MLSRVGVRNRVPLTPTIIHGIYHMIAQPPPPTHTKPHKHAMTNTNRVPITPIAAHYRHKETGPPTSPKQ